MKGDSIKAEKKIKEQTQSFQRMPNIGGKSYVIEGNGNVTFVKGVNNDKLPTEYK